MPLIPPTSEPPELLDYTDYPAVRARFERQVRDAVEQSFPVGNEKFELRLADVKYQNPKQYTLTEQKDAILGGRTLANRLTGKWELWDKATNKLVDRSQARTVLNVPYFTDRGTFIRGGTEYSISKQFRLRPSIYTRVTDDDLIEAQFNAKPQTGSSFRIFMEPATSVFYLRHRGRKIPLYPVLRAMGYKPEQLRSFWGKDIVEANTRMERSPHAVNWLSQFKPDAEELPEVAERDELVQEKEAALDKEAILATDAFYESIRPKLLQSFLRVEFDPDAVRSTLGKPFERAQPEALVEATRKILRVAHDQDTTDDRDSLEYQTIHDAGDFLSDKIKNDQQNLMRTVLWRLTGRPDLSRIPASVLDRHVSHLFNESGLANQPEESNPLDMFEQNQRVIRLGEGGISCHSEDTEVLTAEGWKFWRDVVDEDALVTQESAQIVFRRPLKLYKEWYSGQLCHGKTEQLDYLVTPNHRLFVEYSGAKGWIGPVFRTAMEMHGKRARHPIAVGEYTGGVSADSFELPPAPVDKGNAGGQHRSIRSFRMTDWAILVGYYLAEGYYSYDPERKEYRTFITKDKAANPDEYRLIDELLVRMGISYRFEAAHHQFVINGKEFAYYFRQFGKSADKFVPDYIMSGSSEIRRAFFTAITTMDHAGDYPPSEKIVYSSASLRMLEQVAFLGILLGYNAHYRSIHSRYHQVRLRKRNHLVIMLQHQRDQYGLVPYDGFVYCADVGGGLLLTRRNGKTFWSGNSVDAIPKDARQVQPSYFGFIDAIRSPESLKIGVDVKLARNVRKGPDGLLYRQFINAKTDKPEWVSAKQAARSVIAFPGSLDNDDKYVAAMVRSREVQYVPREEVQYTLASGDEMFSYGANLVPLKSGCKGMRLLMGAKFSSQALPLASRQAPLVQTTAGPDDDKSMESRLGVYMGAVHAPVGGIVRSVYPDHLMLEDEQGKRHRLDLYDQFPFARKTYVRSIPRVKAGQRVSPGELLASSNYTTDDGTMALGTNLRVGYLNWDGKNFEDAVVISESAAAKLTSEMMYTRDLEKDDDLHIEKRKFSVIYPSAFSRQQLDTISDEGVVRPGTVLQQGDPLFLAVREREPGPQTLGRRLRSNESETWDHPFSGVVTAVSPTKKGWAVAIRANVPMMVADKLSNRMGGKGVVASIERDEDMPKDAKGRPLDVLLSPLTVVSRTNSNQLLETALGKVAEKTGKPYVLDGFSKGNLAEFAQEELRRHNLSDTEDLLDPRSGKTIPQVFTGVQYFYKLQHTSEGKGKARATGAYTAEDQPSKGSYSGCFPAQQTVLTATGARRISEIVEKRHSEFVWTFDHTVKQWCYRPVTNWFSYRADVSELLQIEVEGAASVCGGKHVKHCSCLYPTRNHRVFLYDGRELLAGELRVGDELCTWGPVPTDDQLDLLLGSLLGDAYFAEGGIQIMHSAKQQNYIRFKQGVLSGLLATVNSCCDTGAPDGKRHKRTLLTLGNHDIRNKLGALCLRDGRKRVTREWLERIGDVGLCLLVLDGGSIGNHTKKTGRLCLQGSLATQSLSREEVELLAVWLGERLRQPTPTVGWYVKKLNSNIKRQSREPQPQIHFSRDMCWALVELLAQTIPWEAVPASKRTLCRLMRERQQLQPPRKLQCFCELGKVPARIRAIAPYRHPKPGITEINVYDLTVADTHSYTAGNVLVSNSKHLGDMEVQSLLSHGAGAVLRDLKLIKGQRNDTLWRNLKLGQPPITPGTPMVYDKFKNLILASGVQLRKDKSGEHIFAMTNEQATALTGDREVLKPATYGAVSGKPLPGGLFDPALTGSELDGNRWAFVRLPEKLPNPVMEDALRSILGMTQKQFEGVVAGDVEYSGKRGGEALTSMLAAIDVKNEKARAMEEIKSGARSRRDAAVRRYTYLDAMDQHGIKPVEFMMDRVPVLPPRFRPITVNPKMTVVADPNYMYKALLESAEDYNEAKQLPPAMQADARRHLYHTYKALVGTADPLQPNLQQKNIGGILQQLFGKGSSKYCYDDETEVLTENGWMRWRDYGGQCMLATIHPLTQMFEYHQPTEIIHEQYQGPMIHFEGRRKHIDMLVTPNHRQWIRWNDHRIKGMQNMEKGWVFVYAEDINGGTGCHFRHAAVGFNGDKSLPSFVTGNPELFAELVGWWVAKGWLHSDGCTAYICQAPTQVAYCARIDEVVNLSGFRHSRHVYKRKGVCKSGKNREDSVYWGIHNKELVNWLRTNCGDGARNKHLSREIRGWRDGLLRAFFKGYCGGDAARRTHPHKGNSKTHRATHEFVSYDRLSSASSQLIFDLQDVGIKIGVPISLYGRKGRNGEVYLGDIQACVYSPIEGSGFVKTVDYSGQIHCATVPNGLLIVRRHGLPVVSGNSFVQRRLLGTNIDMTGMAVLTPNPSLTMDEVGLPEALAWDLYEPFIIRHLVRQGMPATVAAKAVSDKASPARSALQAVVRERPVLVNRAPTLHKYSIMAFWPQLTKGHTLQMPPTVYKPFGADNDGDVMSFSVPVSAEAVQEAVDKMMPSKNLLAARNDAPLYTLGAEYLHGLYFASKEPNTRKAVKRFASRQEAMAAFRKGLIGVDDPIEIPGET